MKRNIKKLISLIMVMIIATGYYFWSEKNINDMLPDRPPLNENAETITIDTIPKFNGSPYVVLYDNIPHFNESDRTTETFEAYGPLDYLGRCTVAYSNISSELMPTGERQSISHIKPTGWQSVEYDGIDGKHLYNRCHLIGRQLTGEEDNEQNLITGTRSFNVDGMLPFEDMVADYILETDNHVLYRVTPIYDGNDLVAKGVQMEGESVEDNAEGIKFNVFIYNNQLGISIDYATGESQIDNSLHNNGSN